MRARLNRAQPGNHKNTSMRLTGNRTMGFLQWPTFQRCYESGHMTSILQSDRATTPNPAKVSHQQNEYIRQRRRPNPENRCHIRALWYER